MSPATVVSLWLTIVYVTAQSDFLIVPDASNGNIYRLDIATGESSIITSGEERPAGVAYDPTIETLFWTDIKINALKSCKLDGSNKTLIYRMPIPSTSDGLAISSQDQRIYYADTGANMIGVINYDGTGQQDFITTDLLEPRGIAVNAEQRTIYFSDWGFTPARIWSANMDDGSNRVLLVNSAIELPNGLAIDVATNELFWCDAGTDTIEKTDLTGQNRVTVATRFGDHWFGIAIDSQNIYVTSWNVPYVNQLPRTGGSFTAFQSQAFGQQGGIAISTTTDI